MNNIIPSEQKYQNITQLYFGPGTLSVVINFHLSSAAIAKRFTAGMAANKTISNRRQPVEIVAGCNTHVY